MTEHRSPITTVDGFGRDEVVSGGYDGQVIAWRHTAGGAGVLEARWSVAFDDLVNDVRTSPDGTAVAVAVADRFAYVLDLADGAHRLALGPHGDDVNVVRWLPDGRGLVCVMDHLDPLVHLWRPPAGSDAGDGAWTARVLRGHRSGVFGAALDPTGTRLATAAEDATARIWDLTTEAELHVLAHPGDPEAIDWSPDGSLVATGCDDGRCRLWDPVAGALVRTLEDARAAVRFVRFSADGRRLLVGAYDATLREYDTADWSVRTELRRPDQWERAAAHLGTAVVVGSMGARPVLHAVPDGMGPSPSPSTDPVPTHRRPTFGINALAVRGDRLAIGRDDGAVVVATLDPAGAVRDEVVVARHAGIVNAVAHAPDGRSIASADYRGTLGIAPLGPDSRGPARFAPTPDGGPINALVWHPDGERLFSAGYDGVIRMWAGTEQLAQWRAHHAPIKSLCWSAPAGLLVAGSSDGTLSAWRAPAPGDRHATRGAQPAPDPVWRAGGPDVVLVNAVAADAAGAVVSASRDLHLRRWAAEDGALLEVLPAAHTKSVKAVAASAEGRRLVSGSYDGTGLLWTWRDGGWRWRRLLHHGKPGVPAVGLHRGAPLTAGWDGTIAHWSATDTATVWSPSRTVDP